MGRAKHCTSCGAALEWRMNQVKCKCEYCGTITVDEDVDWDEYESDMPEDEAVKAKYRVTIFRKRMYYGLLCSVQVHINDQVRMSFSNGETKTIELEEGLIEAKFQALGLKTEVVRFQLRQDANIEFHITIAGRITVNIQ